MVDREKKERKRGNFRKISISFSFEGRRELWEFLAEEKNWMNRWEPFEPLRDDLKAALSYLLRSKKFRALQ